VIGRFIVRVKYPDVFLKTKIVPDFAFHRQGFLGDIHVEKDSVCVWKNHILLNLGEISEHRFQFGHATKIDYFFILFSNHTAKYTPPKNKKSPKNI
jgi:hypothetical protein